MNKFFYIGAITAGFAASAWAQESSSLLKPVNELPTLGNQTSSKEAIGHKSGTPKESKKKEAKGPTEITSTKGVTFDENSRMGVFTGDVRVKDPQFNLVADKLTIYLKKDKTTSSAPGPQTAKPAASGSNSQVAKSGTAAPSNGKSTEDSPLGGGLERAIAEGHVVITQDKPAEDGGEPKHYVGKASKADYDSKTGDVVLTGWPQIQQGINTQVATEEGTVMVLNRDGRLKTTGGCHTVIQDQGDVKPNDSKGQ